MTSGDILNAIDTSVTMARDNFPSISRDKGEDYAHGVLHGLSSLRVWLRSHEFEKYLEREKQKSKEVNSTTETPK